MDTLHTSSEEIELLLDCARAYCDCIECEQQDITRRAQVAHFAASWIAQHPVSEPEELPCEQSGVQTIRPPRMGSSKGASRGRAA